MQTAKHEQRMILEPLADCKYSPAVCTITVVATLRAILENSVLSVCNGEVQKACSRTSVVSWRLNVAAFYHGQA